MKATPENAILNPPAPGIERGLAHHIYAAESSLCQRVLDFVVGRPGAAGDALPFFA